MVRSMRIQTFLSCSFEPEDKGVVDFFASICHALDLNCINVDKGYSRTPPEQARELIMDSQVLIAVATCREELKSGSYSMPKAVDQEISMAFANNRKILIFLENGVDTTSGFTDKYSTYLEFDRAKLCSPEFLERVVASIHGIKMEVISPEELQLEQIGQQNVFAEKYRNKIELIDNSGSFTWRYSGTRRLKFLSRFTDPIKAGAWPAAPIEEKASTDLIQWWYRIEDSNKPFRFIPTLEKHTPDTCLISIAIDPYPEKDDIIEYSMTFESPYLNPVFFEDIKDPQPEVIVNGVKYLCADGCVPTVRTQDLKIQFWFPASLGLKQEDFLPYVGSYTNKIDYLVEDEIKRMTVTSEENFDYLQISVL